MTDSDDLAHLDATAQADLVRRGEATPAELVEAACARVERLDPLVHAVVLPRLERAADEARGRLPDGPFRGVPTLVKDLGCTTAGEPFTDGSRFLQRAGARATTTATVARRIAAAGLVSLGRTNSPELGLLPTAEPAAWGPTSNPWDLGRTTGGSSGGAAAAVAAGLVPVAHGSDGGGSIRIPASCCGLVGLKPSRGRVSTGPPGSELTGPFSTHFVLTRTVRDAAAMLDALSGPEPGDAVVAPPPAVPFAELARRDPGRLRVGVTAAAPRASGPVDPECVAAVDEAARLLEGLGHHVEAAHPGALDEHDLGPALGPVWSVLAASRVAAAERLVGRGAAGDDLEPLTWARVEQGRRTDALGWVDALDALQAFTREAAAWWAGGHDVLLTPTLAEPPPPLGTFTSTPEAPMRAYDAVRRFAPFTGAWNATGQPAISLPVHTTAEGLPVGVQLVAAWGREDLLLALARALEDACGWSDRRPPVHA